MNLSKLVLLFRLFLIRVMASSDLISIPLYLDGPQKGWKFQNKGKGLGFSLLILKQVRPHIDTPEGFLQFALFCTESYTAHVNTKEPISFEETLENIRQFGISFSEEEKSFLKSCDFFQKHKELSANFVGTPVLILIFINLFFI